MMSHWEIQIKTVLNNHIQYTEKKLGLEENVELRIKRLEAVRLTIKKMKLSKWEKIIPMWYSNFENIVLYHFNSIKSNEQHINNFIWNLLDTAFNTFKDLVTGRLKICIRYHF
jgi:hypothetical protein